MDRSKPKYLDAGLSPEERAESLLSEMSLDEKLAQTGCIFPFDRLYLNMEWISEQTPSGIGEVSTLEVRRIESLKEAAEWQRSVQKIIMSNSPHNIPAIFHMEGLCGAFIQDSTSFPAGIARGSGWDPVLEEKIAGIVGRQETAWGATHILAPVLDISRDPRMGRQGETYGEDPVLAGALGAAYVRGINSTCEDGKKPESVAKHFVAFHNSQGGIHGTHSMTTPRELREIYASPFQAAIQEGLRGVMPCYCSIDGEPASVSKRLLTDLLRTEMGFDGICASDYGGVGNAHSVQHIGEDPGEAGQLAMEAGMDIEMPSETGFGNALKQRILDGDMDISVLDRAVLRVLTAKFRMGLFEHPFAMEYDELRKIYDDPSSREVSLQSARESIILLKNDDALPISKDVRRIALIGPHADEPRKMFGGYTHMCMMESTLAAASSIAGVDDVTKESDPGVSYVPGTQIQSDEGPEFDHILEVQKPGCESLRAALERMLPGCEITCSYGYPVAGPDKSGFEEALENAESADLVILTLGGKHGTCSIASMGEGVDSSDINLPECQDAFIREVSKLGKPVIGVHFDGRPVSSDTADRLLSAIVEAWSPAECGAQAVAEVLTGEYNPGGRLPVSVVYSAGQIPVYYNHPHGSAWHQGESIGFPNYVDLPHRPRYCFGYGLSYTDFSYDDFELDREHIRPDEKFNASIRITNTGDVAGDEVVQLYISDRFASVVRPVQELKGFCRIRLEQGESRRVSFEMDPAKLAFLDRDMKWKIEKGEYEIRIGSSSEDIKASGTITITDNAWTDGRERAGSAEVTIPGE